MKSDLDALMKARNLDALIVFGNAEHNPPMTYLTGGGHVSHATLIKKRDEKAILFFGDMERDEAAKSGLRLIPYSKYDFDELSKKANRDGLLQLLEVGVRLTLHRAEVVVLLHGVTCASSTRPPPRGRPCARR